MKCPFDGHDLEYYEYRGHTGVVAPDGYREEFKQSAYFCEYCGEQYSVLQIEGEPKVYTSDAQFMADYYQAFKELEESMKK